jgi:capsular polysaccharide biosynthesis protein
MEVFSMAEMQEEEIDLREYINVMLKRKVIIILIFLIAVFTAALVSYFVLSPIYQSSVSFQVSTELTKQQYYPTPSTNPYISDILILLSSDSILREAAGRINLSYDLNEMKRKIKSTNIKDTNIITLTVEDENSKLAKDLANSIVKVFIEKNQSIYDEKRKMAEENLRIYIEQLDDIEKNIVEIEKTKLKIANSQDISDVEKHLQTSLLLNSLATERNSYNFLISKISSIKEDLMNYKGFKIIDPASEPTAPIKPHKKLNILIAGVLGLFVGIFVAFFLEFWQKG